jgi:2-polyprenyl-3-methyl-5-hydroxy-6-metoxy-1,4-benzoquinol methylase
MKTHELTESEQQIISSLSWFRSRYALFLGADMDRPANNDNLTSFGEAWIGTFKHDWTNALDSLMEKEILYVKNDEYIFTEQGESIRKEVEQNTPFFKYEYNNFFHLEQNSTAHKEFCKQVYGEDLSQHGLINQQELSLLIEQLHKQHPQNILDIGCGNGRITEYLSAQLPSHFIGIDISSEAIRIARSRVREKTNVAFHEGNMNDLDTHQKYDAILLLDTLYYASNPQSTLKQCLELLEPNGTLYVYFSQWIMSTKQAAYLSGDNTSLARMIQELEGSFTFTDLTVSGLNHWKKKLEVLNELKNTFFMEGSKDLWDYRYREALRYAQWGDDKYSRYLYTINRP